jgi:sulfide:quinone oxidoreductase
MPGKTVLILGGGWGGLTAAHHLRDLLPDEHRVVVVELSDTFAVCVSNLWLMTGERSGLEQVRRRMENLKRPGIDWVHAEATHLDPDGLSVDTTAGRLEADYMVIALGADLNPEAVPGFSETAHNLYDGEGAAELGRLLDGFDGGRIVVLVAGAPFRCPPAPYEAAMLVEALARRRGIRDSVELSLYTPEPQPMAVAGPAVGEALVDMLSERGIDYHPEQTVTRIDAEAGTLHFGDRAVPFDLLIGVPPHRAPALVTGAGLTDGTGYVPVHPQTLEILADPDNLETQHPNVFAIGDVTAIRLLNSMLLPKAGVFAEAQAQVVAATIAADIKGDPKPTGYDGQGFCYVEVGEGLAAYGTGDFYAYPAPRVLLESPTPEARRAKEEYEQLLDAWFE